jgi:hypothetical protein
LVIYAAAAILEKGHTHLTQKDFVLEIIAFEIPLQEDITNNIYNEPYI